MQFSDGTKEHTRGPWFVGSEHDKYPANDRLNYNKDEPPVYQYDDSGWPYFVGINETRVGKSDIHVACGIQDLEDARLIAAAPELLATLKYVLDADKYNGGMTMGDAALSPAIRGKIERIIAEAEA